jgi:phosphohistidine phosphatase
MPRYLYLLRHAQSVEKQMGQSDQGRELTNEGIKQSLLIANYLIKQKTLLDCIICSHAERAQVTANLICEALKFDPGKIYSKEDLYEASTRVLFNFVSHLEDNLHHVMCIGHNPGISYLAEYLTKAEIGDMTTGGMAIIEFNRTSWKEITEGNGELIRYVYPDMLDTY